MKHLAHLSPADAHLLDAMLTHRLKLTPDTTTAETERARRLRGVMSLLDQYDVDAAPEDLVARTLTRIQEAKQQRTVAGRKRTWLPSPHRLRDTFASAAHEARIHPLDLKVLMNHALPSTGDVTCGYIRPSIGHLRCCVEEIAAFLAERMTPGKSDGSTPTRAGDR